MSAHFPLSEFRCRDGTPVPPEHVADCEMLASQLEIVRAADGRPQEVVSGYRTGAYNRKKGGAKLSRHLDATAADVRPIVKVAGVRVPWFLVRGKVAIIARYHDMILRMKQEGELPLVWGVGYYEGKWVHIDIRPRPADGHLARWEGTGIGAEVIG